MQIILDKGPIARSKPYEVSIDFQNLFEIPVLGKKKLWYFCTRTLLRLVRRQAAHRALGVVTIVCVCRIKMEFPGGVKFFTFSEHARNSFLVISRPTFGKVESAPPPAPMGNSTFQKYISKCSKLLRIRPRSSSVP